MNVLILEGGKLGRSIADRLLVRDGYRLKFRTAEYQLLFSETNEETCRELEERFGQPIHRGDATKEDLFERVGVDHVDVAIAASGDDRRNIVIALQAKRSGIQQVIALVEDNDYVALLRDHGIQGISTLQATAVMVENSLDQPGIAEPLDLGEGFAGLMGVTVRETADAAGKRIQELKLPYECVIAAVIRGNKFVVPRGDTLIEADQRVILVGPDSGIKEAAKIFR